MRNGLDEMLISMPSLELLKQKDDILKKAKKIKNQEMPVVQDYDSDFDLDIPNLLNPAGQEKFFEYLK